MLVGPAKVRACKSFPWKLPLKLEIKNTCLIERGTGYGGCVQRDANRGTNNEIKRLIIRLFKKALVNQGLIMW